MNTFARARMIAGVVLAMAVLWLHGCAPAISVSLPEVSGPVDPAAQSALVSATERCKTVHTWSAEIGVSGRVRNQRVRVRVLAGTSDRGDLRLEGVAPFGAPMFVLAARSD